MIRTAIVEDHQMVREGLVAVLNADARIEVIGAASSVEDFRMKYQTWEIDVLITDFELPDGTGIDVANLVAAGTAVPVLLLSGQNRNRLVEEAVQAGCSGFLSKGVPGSELADAVVTIANGATVFSPEVLRSMASKDRTDIGSTLTEREMQTLQLLAEAKTAGEIADQLFVSPHTIRNHIRAILSKLGARSQLDAVVVAAKAGLVRIAD